MAKGDGTAFRNVAAMLRRGWSNQTRVNLGAPWRPNKCPSVGPSMDGYDDGCGTAGGINNGRCVCIGEIFGRRDLGIHALRVANSPAALPNVSARSPRPVMLRTFVPRQGANRRTRQLWALPGLSRASRALHDQQGRRDSAWCSHECGPVSAISPGTLSYVVKPYSSPRVGQNDPCEMVSKPYKITGHLSSRVCSNHESRLLASRTHPGLIASNQVEPSSRGGLGGLCESHDAGSNVRARHPVPPEPTLSATTRKPEHYQAHISRHNAIEPPLL
ncbi:uncharacterized protein PSANT_04262 [Moesziomyces antarcticus]|uniref:Uncharacterized protein n=1 Tax=Pseudozyma antarctica TaxID=84753 RepID=A0A5C3FQY3_PSEA2|nr:uncharacterized protein PSANT_04262 [Moesziomyces antarcticus]